MKLIVLEGIDGCGKETQADLLYKALLEQGNKVKKISFPNYESKSSALVKQYLSGEFGKASEVNPFAKSLFFAVDQWASYKTDGWADFDGIVLADRYASSNFIYQSTGFSAENMDEFLDWLDDLYWEKLQLPKPDLTILLDMPRWASEYLTKDRANKITGEKEKDVNEKDLSMQDRAAINAVHIADKYKWEVVSCTDEKRILSIEEIHNKIKTCVAEHM